MAKILIEIAGKTTKTLCEMSQEAIRPIEKNQK
jgi:hypothetical protein